MDAQPDETPRPARTPDGAAPPADAMDQSGALGPDREPEASPFVVVGLGASAGGLEALEAFFAGLPKTDGAAFVVVVHLAPDQESRMAEVLDRAVPIPVTQVAEAVRVEPGHVYVIPPDRNLVMEDGHLRLATLESERARRRPIDHFFRTLAEAYGERSVGVVLSGTGQNGTVGVRRVRELGGLVLAQDPDDAAFDEMPRSALASGVVDHVAPASGLGREAIDYADRLRETRVPDGEVAEVPPDDVRTVQRILALLKSRTGHDFGHYKRSTVLRRLARRVHVVGADGLGSYYDELRGRPSEAEALLDDLLISVTNFFRDREAFDALQETVIPRLFEGKRAGDEVRVWTAGCATGEEAYSVAILLAEHAATLTDPPGVQVFATDLSEAAVRAARAGVYPESVEADVSAERLRRFFRRVQGGYQVTPALRETVLFAPHSLLKDPPFGHLDLVTCRNLLIYLQRDLQRRVLELFHYVLRPGGTLFLGSSETAEAASALYQAEDKSARIYRRRDAENVVPDLPRRVRVPVPAASEARAAPPAAAGGPPSFAELHRRARAAAAPPSVLVTVDRETVHVSEGAGPYLRLSEGEPTQNVLRLVLPALRPAVQAALYGARRSGAPVASAPVRVEVEGAARAVTVRAAPVEGADLFQVAFEAAAPPPARPAGGEAEVLGAELQDTQEQLQLSLEEFETSREELKAQNEELQSVNEELRSTAEELETAKEEAQSMAEELQTANDELKAKVEELAEATGDLENLVVSTEIATLFLDRALRIKWFTPHVRRHFHVRDSDLGRPLADLAPRFGGGPLVEDAEAVLDRLQVREREVEGEDGRWYLVHVRPYRTLADRIDGVVVTFVDITRRRGAEAALRDSEGQLRSVLENVPAGVIVARADGRLLFGNPEVERIFGRPFIPSEGLEGYRDWPLLLPDADGPFPLERMPMVRSLRAGETVVGEAMRLRRPDGSTRAVVVNSQPVRNASGAVAFGVAAFVDVTDEREAERELRASEERYRVLVEGATEYAILMLDPDGQVTTWNEGAERIFGWDEDEVLGRPGALVFTEEDRAAGVPEDEMARALENGAADDDRPHVRKDGSRFWATGVMTPLRHDDGSLRGFAKLLRDNTARREAEAALRQSEGRFRQAVDAAELGTWSFSVAEGVTLLDARARDIFGFEAEAVGRDEMLTRIHPDDLEAFEAERDRTLRPDTPDTFAETHRVVRPDGTVRWVRGQARVFFEGEGAARVPVRAIGVVLDVTEQREAEGALRESEERFRRTAEAVPDILFTADADGAVTYVNERFEQATGRPAAEALGTSMWEAFVHPDDRGEAESLFEDHRGRGEPYEARHRLRAAGGAFRWHLTRAQPARGAGGALEGWYGTSTDIDRLVRAEEEARALNQTLERRVRERTALARRLLTRLTVAEEGERKRISSLLHDDLQQRLYGLSMALTLLRGPVEEAGDPALLDKAEAVLADATALTRTLATELSPAALDAADLAEVLGWTADHVQRQYGLAVEVDVEPGCRIEDHAVRVAVYQAVREALFNVVKHAEASRARLVARTETEGVGDAPGGAVVVRVEDDGVGFAAPPPGEPTEGTGLGLPGAASRIDLVGGRFEVESAPGEGTRLTMTVPAGADPPGET